LLEFGKNSPGEFFLAIPTNPGGWS